MLKYGGEVKGKVHSDKHTNKMKLCKSMYVKVHIRELYTSLLIHSVNTKNTSTSRKHWSPLHYVGYVCTVLLPAVWI
jgi:hypothetical protein